MGRYQKGSMYNAEACSTAGCQTRCYPLKQRHFLDDHPVALQLWMEPAIVDYRSSPQLLSPSLSFPMPGKLKAGGHTNCTKITPNLYLQVSFRFVEAWGLRLRVWRFVGIECRVFRCALLQCEPHRLTAKPIHICSSQSNSDEAPRTAAVEPHRRGPAPAPPPLAAFREAPIQRSCNGKASRGALSSPHS